MVKNIIKELFAYLAAGFAIWCCILIISEGDVIYDEIISAIERCFNIIIPSLFAFMAISGIIINTKIYYYISKPFYPVSRFLIKMPNSLFFVFLMGNISGYPVGAKLLTQMTEQKTISKRTAEIMCCFSYGGGPAFFTGAIGMAVFGSSKIGLIIFLSVAASNFIVALIMSRIFKLESNNFKEKIAFSSDSLIDAIISTGKSLFVICVTIIFFSALMALLDSKGFFNFLQQAGLSKNYCTIVKSIFEISYISKLNGKPYSMLPLIAGACSFGGICVLLQIKAMVGKAFSLKLFFIMRIVSAIISVIICRFVSKLLLPDIISAAITKTEISVEPNNFIPSLCLIAMIFLIALRERIKVSSKRKEPSPHVAETAHN